MLHLFLFPAFALAAPGLCHHDDVYENDYDDNVGLDDSKDDVDADLIAPQTNFSRRSSLQPWSWSCPYTCSTCHQVDTSMTTVYDAFS